MNAFSPINHATNQFQRSEATGSLANSFSFIFEIKALLVLNMQLST